MALNLTCPHCGKRFTSPLSESDVEYVSLGNGLPDAIFPLLEPGEERHVDQRLCCPTCYTRAGETPLKLGKDHPYSLKAHKRRLLQVDAETAVDPIAKQKAQSDLAKLDTP